MRCPHCKGKLLQKSGDKVRLRTEGVHVFQNGSCRAKCHWCKAEVEVPIQIKPGTEVPAERLVVRRA